MNRTKKELNVKIRLAEHQIRILEERLQAARDVNFELRKYLSAMQTELDAKSEPASAKGMKPCFPDGIVIVLL